MIPIDEQIEKLKSLINDYEYGNVDAGIWSDILASLEDYKRITEAEMPVEPKVYQQQFFCDDGTIESHEAVLKHDYDALKAYAQRKDAELIAYLRNHAQDFIKLIEAAERHCVKRMLDDNHELRQALAAFKEKS